MLIRYLVANMLKSQAQEAVRSKVEQAVTDQARNIAEMKQGREMPPVNWLWSSPILWKLPEWSIKWKV